MKEYPLLLKSEMVRAIFEGRKTQTRCPIVPQPMNIIAGNLNKEKEVYCQFEDGDKLINCPWGVGDRLWVKETWAVHVAWNDTSPSQIEIPNHGIQIWYKSSPPKPPTIGKWRSSIYMPRWASRITLEITNIRVERIREISEEDAQQEGIDFYQVSPEGNGSYRYPFEMFWDSLYDKKGYGWDKNPWVWVREFRRR